MANNERPEDVPAKAKTERLEARIQPDVKELIERAATRLGTTVSDFVVQSSFAHALEVVERLEMVRLNRKQSKAFAEALANPAAPAPALVSAMIEHRKSFEPRR